MLTPITFSLLALIILPNMYAPSGQNWHQAPVNSSISTFFVNEDGTELITLLFLASSQLKSDNN